MRRGDRSRLRWALITSAVIHGGVIALMWAMVSNRPYTPPMRTYAVDIVSPPPQLAGEFDPGNGEAPQLGPEADPAPEPTPAATPEPPAPQPKPAEPKPAAEAPRPTPPKKEPSPRPEPTRKPEPAKPATPAAKPATPAPKPEAPKNDASKSDASKTAGTGSKPAATPEKVAGGGEGGGRGASKGANPDPNSPGGEGIDLRLRGAQCPSPDYCANIIRQLYRYFRPPSGAGGEEAEVFFYINRDGSASDIRVLQGSGSFRFRSAAMEAVEQAGMNRAFGALPRSFSVDRLPVSFFFRPAR